MNRKIISASPTYANGRELSRPHKRITVAELDAANREFWRVEAMRQRVGGMTNLPDHVRDLILQHGPKTIRAAIRRENDAAANAISARDRLIRQTGARRSVEARRQQTLERDRRIHDANANGVTVKAISKVRKIRGRNRISIATIYRILSKPRP